MSLGPRNRYDKPKPQAIEYPDQLTRDQAIEERWTYERDGTMSTLAYVSAHRDRLIPEFMSWYSTAQVEGESKDQAISKWEAVKFGKILDTAAHGVLSFAILDAFFPNRHGKKWEPKPTPAKTPSSVKGMVKALANSMPATRMSQEEIDRRLMELERQKREIVPEEEPPF